MTDIGQLTDFEPGPHRTWRGFLFQSLTALNDICLAVGIFSLPACISFAILKYRLYAIDRLISRTLSYTLVTGIPVGVYAGVVSFVTRVLPFHTPVAVAASTLAVAALFNPLRRRVQHVIDRRYSRARYDADRTVVAFAARLTDEVTWTRSGTTWPAPYTRPWNPPTCRCGSADAENASSGQPGNTKRD